MNNEFMRREDESEYAYIYRVGSNKERIGSWQDVADLINSQLGYEYTESKYRKDYNAFKKMFEANREHFTNVTEQLSAIEQRELDLKREARKFYDQRQALTRVVNAQAREQSLHECIKQAAEQLNETKPLDIASPVFDQLDTRQNEAVLCLTDWHYGMICDNIFNRYNTDICRERVSKLVAEVSKRLKLHQVSTLHVLLMGDFAHGAIHPTVRIESTEQTCDQLMQVSELLAETIAGLSAEVEVVKVYATYGNHMRTVQNKKESVHSDNMEKIIPWWLQERLRGNTKIKFQESVYEFIVVSACGKLIVATHGDLDNVKDFGITSSMLFSQFFGCPIDYAIMGDKHHIESVDRFGVESMIAPALCGSDNHASSKRLYSKPGQLLVTFHPEYGRDAVYNITLE